MYAPRVHGVRDMRYEEVPEPQVGPGEILLKVNLCGICGSDVHLYDAGATLDGQVMGHEFVGTIEELGPGVANWSVGERVMEAMSDPCGGCDFCSAGQPDLCFHHYIMESEGGADVHGRGRVVVGGYGPYLTMEANRLMRVPDEFSDEAAANVEAAAVGFHAVSRSGIRLGDSVVIFGAGPIGLYLLQSARAAGAGRVYMVEPVASRAAVARQLGADQVLDPRASEDVVAELIDLTDGGPDLVMEGAGVPMTLQQALDVARPEGRVSLVGVSLRSSPLNPAVIVEKELRVRSSLALIRQDVPRTIELFRSGAMNVEPMITGTIPPWEVGDAMERLLHPNDEIKVLVNPQLTR